MTDAVVGFVTCSSKSEARKIARAILRKKLAACVNILAGVESHYWWQGKLEQARECLLLIKTTRSKRQFVIRTVRAVHSYDLPEMIFVNVTDGERKYLEWIRKSVRS